MKKIHYKINQVIEFITSPISDLFRYLKCSENSIIEEMVEFTPILNKYIKKSSNQRRSIYLELPGSGIIKIERCYKKEDIDCKYEDIDKVWLSYGTKIGNYMIDFHKYSRFDNVEHVCEYIIETNRFLIDEIRDYKIDKLINEI